MKTLCLAILMVSFTAFADTYDCTDANGNDISSSTNKIRRQIQRADSCETAHNLVQGCFMGSGQDVEMASLAYDVCINELRTLGASQSVLNTVKTMTRMCSALYAEKTESMYQSMQANCTVDAANWVVNTYKTASEN